MLFYTGFNYIELYSIWFISSQSWSIFYQFLSVNYLSCLSQPTVSKILSNVVNALNDLMQDWIQFLIEETEIQHIKEMWVFNKCINFISFQYAATLKGDLKLNIFTFRNQHLKILKNNFWFNVTGSGLAHSSQALLAQ